MVPVWYPWIWSIIIYSTAIQLLSFVHTSTSFTNRWITFWHSVSPRLETEKKTWHDDLSYRNISRYWRSDAFFNTLCEGEELDPSRVDQNHQISWYQSVPVLSRPLGQFTVTSSAGIREKFSRYCHGHYQGKDRTNWTSRVRTCFVCLLYQRTKRKSNQTPLDVVPHVRVKERSPSCSCLFFLHELINLPKHVRISSVVEVIQGVDHLWKTW